MRHSVSENPPGAETPAWREKFRDGNSETRDPEPGTRRVTEPSEMRREERGRKKGQGSLHEAKKKVALGIRFRQEADPSISLSHYRVLDHF